jgi:hypothetical protein
MENAGSVPAVTLMTGIAKNRVNDRSADRPDENRLGR